MIASECVGCRTFPCTDVLHQCYIVPGVEVNPDAITIIMISEAAPASASDYYYSGGDSLFERTTLQAFNDAGLKVTSIQELIDLGVYFTTAVKCGKTGYGIATATINECAYILEKELLLFPNAKIVMLMGDVAIKAINTIARRANQPRVIPATPTYKLRCQQFYFQGKRVLPSYLQAGPSFFIEKSKRRMIAEDISAALKLVQQG